MTRPATSTTVGSRFSWKEVAAVMFVCAVIAVPVVGILHFLANNSASAKRHAWVVENCDYIGSRIEAQAFGVQRIWRYDCDGVIEETRVRP